GADQAHRLLEPEARAHALGVVRITGLELRHFGSHAGVSSRRFTACFNVYVNVNSALKKCKRSGNLVAASADAGTVDPAHELGPRRGRALGVVAEQGLALALEHVD